jgi:zinc protease
MFGRSSIVLFLGISLMIVFAAQTVVASVDQEAMEEEAMSQLENSLHKQFVKDDNFVIKKVLPNGMTVLVRAVHTIPKVSIQLWYNVGSKDEMTGEKGIAHLIEHMIFKGTQGKDSLNMSEVDINTIAHKLSGNSNAFTAQDFTGYRFDFPTHHWKEALPIMADSMRHAAFKDELLNSEMKAVIQELKMRRDRYSIDLIENLMSTIFADHPYHYPIIGFKQDLWNVHSTDLTKFYKKHYGPSNATLVVIGDVNPEEVFALAQQYFGGIPSETEEVKEKFYFNKDIVSKSVTLYRDVQQPMALLAFTVPGLTEKIDATLDVISWILALGKGSRLHKRLVDETRLVTSVEAFPYNLFDHGVFFIVYEPKNIEDMSTIESIIFEEIGSIINDGLREGELMRAIKKAQVSHFSILEDSQEQAYNVGHFYLATGDENYIFKYLQEEPDVIEAQVLNVLRTYFRPVVAHRGAVVALPESEKKQWQDVQKISDDEDKRILSVRIRNEPLEGQNYATKVVVKEPVEFDFPKAQKELLANDLTLLYHNNSNVPKISISLEFKAKSYYDPIDRQGLYNFMTQMMTEGTENYSAVELADAIESRGMSLSVYPGGASVSLLRDDLDFALEILEEVVCRPTFPEKEMEKTRGKMIADLKGFWDDPSYFAGQLIREVIYKGHPYSKNAIGTMESVSKIKRTDLLNFYKKNITPHETKMAIVGDIEGYDVPALVKKYFGRWEGPSVEELDYPILHLVKPEELTHVINRDQATLCFAGLSVARTNQDYDKLLLFDQVFGGGVLGSMGSQLFKLREQTGLFYSIKGSVISSADKQPGMTLIKTLVSLDRLQEAEKVIKQAINDATEKVDAPDLIEARHAIVNSLTDYFEANSSTASAFLFL